ncbi:hypothetical protein OIU34_24515 [Pararhizobium sp. BT-229]|uniref:hypothetical protein n=1 Tax=Pararhizobium sp. BT-229 TaxID=2986923 RepID=UPI0021F7F8DA|nr:hypothetical protein [Pararhizobium sp. BT-229]MCV9965065.1 hypothetical protein [Pararhizobium sp. BT-229]
MTALDGLKQRHGGAFSRLTADLGRIVGGALVGSVVTAGVYTGAIQPSKFVDMVPFGKGAVVSSLTVSTAVRDNGAAVLGVSGELPKLSDGRPKKLDIDQDLFEEEKVLFVDASTLILADSINDRANDELDAINLIRKAIDEGEGFQDDRIKGEVKADAIIEALSLARVAKDMDAVAYDNHVFKLASGLPRTVVFTEIVETLNWKRQTVRNAVDITTQLADAIRTEDAEAGVLLMQNLTEIMANYEMATTIEKTAEKLAEELESQTGDSAPSLGGSILSVPSLRDAAAPLENLRNHFDSVSSPAKAIAAKGVSL